MACSIIINTRDRPKSLWRCLEALSRQKGIGEHEIIVVDDGSEGDYPAIERNWGKKIPARFLRIRHGGRAAARNRGVKAAKGGRIVFIGDDIIVRPGWLEAHLEGAARPDARLTALIGPCPLEWPKENGGPQSAAFKRRAEPVPFSDIRDPNNAGFLFFISGNLSMDREAFGELGGFDESFKQYGWEDIELGYRFERAGGKVVYDERAKAIHAHPSMTLADLWAREYAIGVTSYQFWNMHPEPQLAFLKFWNEGDAPGPAWRRKLGAKVIELAERFAPGAGFLPGLYDRLAYSYRHLGVAEGRRILDAGAQGSRSGQ